ncbi:uncharacterized protein LOC134277040, partial [Saccostrea cucullata]|uniref:uncharacterized protein LOC134277040 n=1 Tax=Saccostrea cuccullata TaxID=36930 RepID=UPI002ED6AA35
GGEVLMLVQKGGGTNIRDVWIDNANRTQVHRQRLPLRELIGQGTYRIDQSVDSESYDEVHLVFLNAVADPLWRMVFNRTAVRSGKWFEEVKRSSSSISGYNFTITYSRQPPYPLCIGTGSCRDPAWAGIWRSESTESPLFLFNADQHVPRILPHPTREALYIRCESKETFTMEHQYDASSTGMKVLDCLEMCKTKFPYMLMQIDR